MGIPNSLEKYMNAYEMHRKHAFKRMSLEARIDLRRELIAYSHTLQPIKRLAFMKQHRLLPLVGNSL